MMMMVMFIFTHQLHTTVISCHVLTESLDGLYYHWGASRPAYSSGQTVKELEAREDPKITALRTRGHCLSTFSLAQLKSATQTAQRAHVTKQHTYQVCDDWMYSIAAWTH